MSDIWVCSRWNTAPKDEEKFQVINEGNSWYTVRISGEVFCLPKAHYSTCPAPEQWERVETTEKVHNKHRLSVFADGILTPVAEIYLAEGYRVVSLVVERRRT